MKATSHSNFCLQKYLPFPDNDFIYVQNKAKTRRKKTHGILRDLNPNFIKSEEWAPTFPIWIYLPTFHWSKVRFQKKKKNEFD